MSWSDRKREELFDQFSTQLTCLTKKEAQGVVVCPHCGVVLDRRALDQSQAAETRLTLAHVVPQAVGGRQVVLACANCNSRMGSLFDSHLAMFKRSAEVVAGDGTADAKLVLPGVEAPVPAYLTSGETGWTFEVGKHGIDPRLLQQLHAVDKSAIASGQLRVQIPVGRHKRVYRAIAIAAHLKMFWGFGLEYLLSPSVKGLAKWIAADDLDDSPGVTIVDVSDGVEIPDVEVVGVTTDFGPLFLIPVLRPSPSGSVSRCWFLGQRVSQ